MTALVDQLLEIEAGREVWVSEERAFHAGALRTWARVARRELVSLRGEVVALSFAGNPGMALGLLLMDGWASRVLLVPGGVSGEEARGFFERAGVKAVFSDRDDLGDVRPLPALGGIAADDDEPGGGEDEAAETTRWVVPTSGTTGTPKLVSHTLASLTRTVKRDATRGRGLRWGLLYDVSRFAGLQVLLQSFFGGSVLIFPGESDDLGERVESLARHDCNALSATPTLWRNLMMTPGSERLKLQIITLGGEIADDKILTMLRSRYTDARITHVYASTEAGVGFSVSDGEAGFPVSYLEEPPAGMEMRVSGEGLLYVRSAAGEQDYLGEEVALRSEDGWICTEDLVERRGDRFYFLGRQNGAINVGGNKVFPQEVEDCILEFPGAAQAVARAKSNPFMGNVVEAYVVADRGVDEESAGNLATAIQAHCKKQLEPYKVPALVHLVDRLEVSAAGKLIR